jgi:hypothetical protein
MSEVNIGLHVTYHYYRQILTNPEFPRQIFKKETHISSFTKILPVGTEMFHADGQAQRG